MTFAPAGIAIPLPTSRMRSPSMRIVAFASGAPPRPSMRRPARIATVAGSGDWAAMEEAAQRRKKRCRMRASIGERVSPLSSKIENGEKRKVAEKRRESQRENKTQRRKGAGTQRKRSRSASPASLRLCVTDPRFLESSAGVEIAPKFPFAPCPFLAPLRSSPVLSYASRLNVAR